LAFELGLVDRWFPLEGARYASLYSNVLDPEVEAMIRPYHEIILFSHSEKYAQILQQSTGKKVYRVQPRPQPKENTLVADHLLSSLSAYGLIKGDQKHVNVGSLHGSFGRAINPKRVWIHPGSGSRDKMWPLSRFLEVSKRLRSNNWQTDYIIGPAETFLAKPLLMNPETAGSVFQVFDLIELVQLLKSGTAYIGNDSGVTHLAAFLALPTVAIFGPSDPRRWQPQGPRVMVVKPHLNCEPCFETKEKTCKKRECFSGITFERVIQAFYQLG
jgi:ADP-heptose:LPS heptosyltransferase